MDLPVSNRLEPPQCSPLSVTVIRGYPFGCLSGGRRSAAGEKPKDPRKTQLNQELSQNFINDFFYINFNNYLMIFYFVSSA